MTNSFQIELKSTVLDWKSVHSCDGGEKKILAPAFHMSFTKGLEFWVILFNS